MHTCMNTHVNTHMHACTRAHMHTHVHACTHAHMHTHTHPFHLGVFFVGTKVRDGASNPVPVTRQHAGLGKCPSRGGFWAIVEPCRFATHLVLLRKRSSLHHINTGKGRCHTKKKDTKIHPKGHSDLFPALDTLLSQTPPMSPLDPVVVCRSRCGCWVGPSPFALVEIDQSGPSRGHFIWPILRPASRP